MLTLFRTLPQRFLIALVHGYRYALSPWLGSSCRFEPTCSAYAVGALEQHGAMAGTYLMLHRIGRCHPWCRGGADPVPARPPRLFTLLHLHGVADTDLPTSSTDTTAT